MQSNFVCLVASRPLKFVLGGAMGVGTISLGAGPLPSTSSRLWARYAHHVWARQALRARHKVLAHGGQARGGQARVRAAAAEGSTSRSRGTATIVEDETRPRDSAVAGEEASTLPSTNGRLAGIVLPRLASAGLLVTPFFFWGTSMVGLKFLAPHTSPLFVAACRLIPAGALVLAWARSQGRPHPTGPAAWLAVVAFAAVDATMFQGCLVEGLKTTSAGLGSVIIDSQPLSVAILSAVFAGEAITATTSAGIAVGLAGLLLLNFTDMPQLPQMRPDVPPPPRLQQAGISRDGDAIPQVLVAPALAVESTERIERAATGLTASASSSSVWGQEAVALLSRAKSVAGGLASSGEFWMLLSAQCMAVGTVMLPWVARYVDPVIATGWHMVLGGIPLLAASALREGDAVLANLAQLTPLDAAVLAYVSIFGGAVGYGVYFYNASKGNLTALSSLTFLTPVFAATSGYLVLGESLAPVQLLGAGVTLGAVLLINRRPASD